MDTEALTKDLKQTQVLVATGALENYFKVTRVTKYLQLGKDLCPILDWTQLLFQEFL